MWGVLGTYFVQFEILFENVLHCPILQSALKNNSLDGYSPVISHNVLNLLDVISASPSLCLCCSLQVNNLSSASLKFMEPVADAGITESCLSIVLLQGSLDLHKTSP